MSARIFRDLGLVPLALHCIVLEERLLAQLESNAQKVSLQVLKLQLSLPGIMKASLEEKLTALRGCDALLRLNVESEFFPLMGIQASILRVIPVEMVPTGLRAKFEERLHQLQEPLRGFFRSASNASPTREDVVALVKQLPEAQDHQYLAYQINPILPALANALQHAVDLKDADLYLLASGAFAQTGSLESLGLVAALFRNGVRCVIAPPWPLDIEVIQHWLPAFLNAMMHDKPVGEAAADARDAVRMQIDHPCAWGQLHVYGDQEFRLT